MSLTPFFSVLVTFVVSFASYQVLVRYTLIGRLLNGKHAKKRQPTESMVAR